MFKKADLEIYEIKFVDIIMASEMDFTGGGVDPFDEGDD